MADSLTILRPDDWHVHLRDGELMASIVGATAKQFARAIVMPNLKPPVVTVAQAKAYRERILKALPKGAGFEPLMTLYLTDNTSPEEIAKAAKSGFVRAVKYYPAGATTNSDLGVSDIRKCDATLEAMQGAGLPLLVHGEVTDAEIDVFDREAVFIDRTLGPLLKRFAKLKVVLEHITTHEAAVFVERAPDNVAATITPQHLLMNRNAIFAGGLRPHHYCLPVLKREQHRRALVKVATSGNPKFFLGSDTAPHARPTKETSCGCAGIYSAHAALELYAEAFETAGALDKLEAFASHFGADFYGLPRNKAKVTLEKTEWEVPAEYAFGESTVVPLRAGEKLRWRFAG
ncbi:dihydroorotase [Usitatibacter palustris]|uniref:Dihydroorotase n=1 Tax=Usitatibacter palustris TaxID=2732487 RepID=A0A6M4H5M7_9PROT|nr:dihydroorotase [Usitatibacter palustris]QJR13834.1 Dihydroorotase [Usitatibacter palustris]